MNRWSLTKINGYNQLCSCHCLTSTYFQHIPVFFPEFEMILNSIVMLLQVIPLDQCTNLVTAFCDVVIKVEDRDLYPAARVRM